MVREIRKLEIFSEGALKEAEDEVVRFEKILKRKEAVERDLKKRGGIFAGDEGLVSNLPKSLVRKQQEDLLRRERTPTGGKNILGAIVRENKIMQIENRLAKTERLADVAFRKALTGVGLIQGASGLISNPEGIFNIGLGYIKGFLPAAVALQIAQMAIQLWISSYGKGGPNDPRVKVTQDVFSKFGLERDIAIMTGKTYFANSPTLRITQELRSNTMNLKDGFARSQLLRNAYGRP